MKSSNNTNLLKESHDQSEYLSFLQARKTVNCKNLREHQQNVINSIDLFRLQTEKSAQVKQLLTEYSDFFSADKNHVGNVQNFQMKLSLKDDVLVRPVIMLYLKTSIPSEQELNYRFGIILFITSSYCTIKRRYFSTMCRLPGIKRQNHNWKSPTFLYTECYQ